MKFINTKTSHTLEN